MWLRKAETLIAFLLAGANSALYYFIYTISLGPHVILEPWLLNQGFHMYSQLGDNHSPLMPVLLSLGQWILPDGLRLAKLTLVGLIFISAVLTFYAARRLAGSLAGLLAVIFFAAWSYWFGYYKLWHETFLTPLYLLLILIWTSPGKTAGRWRLCSYGLLLGISVLVKQQALFVAAGVISLTILVGGLNHRKALAVFKDILWIGAGAALPVLVYFAFYLLSGGSLEQAWYWVVLFNDAELGRMLASPIPSSFILAILPAFILLLPVLVRFFRKLSGPSDAWSQDAFLLLMLLAGLITIFPRFGAFHLQPMLPPLAIFSGKVLADLPTFVPEAWRKMRTPLARNLMAGAFVLFWAAYAPGWSNIFSPQPRRIYEYSDLPALAEQIRQQTGGGCVYLLPEDEANSNLYYLMKCYPPRLWAFTSYPWFSRDGLPAKEIAALQAESPEWVLYFPGRFNIETHNPQLVSYVENHYQKVFEFSTPIQGTAWLMKRQ